MEYNKSAPYLQSADLVYFANVCFRFYCLSLITKTQREPMRKLTPATIIIVD